ncbi:hypothetical protein MASR1M32_10800 [Rhodobacter sp.]
MIAGALALLRLVAANLIPVLAIAGAGTILWMRAELVEIRAERARLDQQLVQAEADLRRGGRDRRRPPRPYRADGGRGCRTGAADP